MNYLTRLLAVDAPENTTLHSAELSFRGLSLGWLVGLAVIVLLGIIGAIVFYRLEKGTLGWFRRALLIGLRSALLLLLLFLILRPVLLAEFEGRRPQGVALLIDNSQSMTLRDRRLSEADKARVAIALNRLPLKTPLGDKMALPANVPSDPPRTELVRGVLTHPELKLLSNLQRFGPLRPYFFGYDVRGLSEDKKNLAENILAGFKAEDGRTALADGIVKILESKDSDLPSAIVVITDGQDNASKFTLVEAAEKCLDHKVPLHIYGVGSSEGGQLQLKEVVAPETMFVKDNVSIPLRWRAQGFKMGTVEITLSLGGKVVARKPITLKTGEDLRDVLSFEVPSDPEQRENQELVATIQYKSGGEIFKDTLTRTVRVADSKIRILYIEHSPRWEYKFLQPALLRDRRIEVDFILVNADPKTSKTYDEHSPYLQEFPKTRDKFFEAKYNLLIIGDVASSFFSKEQQEWIREFVQNRGGLIVMAGRQNMPNTYENTPLAEVLPVEFTKQKFGLDSELRTQEYPPTLTDAGQRTDWLSLADTPEENLDVWQKKLIGFHWFFPVTKLRPAATPLIVNPRAKMGDQPMPILATQYYGKGQVLWFGTDETWRWRWNYQDKYFIRFWGQIVYQLGLPSLLGDGAKRAQMSLDRSQAIVGTQSTIYVRLLDKDFNPRNDAKVDAELEYLDAKTGEERKTPIVLYPLQGRPGEYSTLVPHHRAGRFELRVKNPEANTFSFRVDLPPKHELEESGLAERALRDAAQISGGRFYREEDLHALAGSIEQHTAKFTRRQEILLWNPLAIVLFVGLITAEWLLRKFSDLS
jgi:hypothetical protein